MFCCFEGFNWWRHKWCRFVVKRGERIKQTNRTYILHGTFPVAVDKIQNTHQTHSVSLNLPGILQNQKGRKNGKLRYLLRTLRRRFLRDLRIFTTSPWVESAIYNPLMLKISSPAWREQIAIRYLHTHPGKMKQNHQEFSWLLYKSNITAFWV